LVVGYEEGYRASWDAAVGRTGGPVFADNTKCWSGDHCIDSSLVPGVFFCNRKAEFVKARPHITDIAPTVLRLFGIEPPSYMDGKAIEMRE
jgi:bisphosphoglycerate-independent phosphoglycerate mutase (AlkP superfamily)